MTASCNSKHQTTKEANSHDETYPTSHRQGVTLSANHRQPQHVQKKLACPFDPHHGYTTRESRREYLKQKGIDDEDAILSLNAEPGNKPLYYWQLYSIWGKDPVLDIVRDFYDLIYEDSSQPWFRSVFEEANSKNHHIWAQAAYWVDAMGGGRYYQGGLGRLTIHHHYNAGKILTREGVHQWMLYMHQAVQQNYARHFSQSDPRILPCLVDFLSSKMESYANEHGWELDARDFDLELFIPSLQMPEKEGAKKQEGVGCQLASIDETTTQEEKKEDAKPRRFWDLT